VQGVSDRTVLVTGGTGGLGAAVTRAFLEEGWRVVVPWVAERELERVEEHERLELVQADLFDPDAAARAVDTAGPSLRALVNLVGGFAIHERVHENPIDAFEQ
jgi:NAD(P)-dependent dehydrogenase (short-subunit alcohol dehydrogenase family)